MQRPPFLRPGDRVSILSTARKVSKEEMGPAVRILQEWGLVVQEAPHLYSEDHQFAGSVEERLKDLQEALDDPGIKAIFCARGGYGTVQLIDRVDFRTFEKQPKWIIGFSDITVLHCHIQRHYGVPTLHAPMPVNFKDLDEHALNTLHKALFSGMDSVEFEGKEEFDRPGTAEGILIGGNLSILYSLTGTDSIFEPQGKILFIEDLDEYLYHVDRMMQNLRKAGILDRINGLLVGGLSDMNDNRIPYGKNAEEIVRENMEEYDIPVAFGFPAGHIKMNLPLYFGVQAKLRVEKGGNRLSYLAAGSSN